MSSRWKMADASSAGRRMFAWLRASFGVDGDLATWFGGCRLWIGVWLPMTKVDP